MNLYRKHVGCIYDDCVSRVSYIRVNNKWKKVGYYFIKCKKLKPIPKTEHESMLALKEIQAQLRQAKIEGRKRIREISGFLNENIKHQFPDGV